MIMQFENKLYLIFSLTLKYWRRRDIYEAALFGVHLVQIAVGGLLYVL